MVTNGSVVKDALRTYAAAGGGGTQYRDSMQSAEHVRSEATSSRVAVEGGRAGHGTMSHCPAYTLRLPYASYTCW